MTRSLPPSISRRDLLRAAGAATLVPWVGSCTTEAAGYSLAQWRRERGSFFYVAHRGSGDVFPEHSLEAYEGALAWGARALEISVVQTSDGVLICQHDLTFDRTTNLKGRVATQPSSVLINGRVVVPRLGPRWQGERAPKIARLEDVLRRIERRAVLFIEPKDDAAFPGIMRLVKERGLQNSVMFKLHGSSKRVLEAKASDFGVFNYVGDASDINTTRIKALTDQLDPAVDVLVVPAFDNADVITPEQISVASAAGVPVWVYPVHRRWEAEYFRQHGVQAVVTSSWGYVSGAVYPVRAPDWSQGAIEGGEMTRFPDADSYGLGWPEAGAIQLASQGSQAFLTLGQLAPLERAAGPYRISLEIRVDTMPSDERSNFTLAFGHEDDRYYEHQSGAQNGYHAILRMDGSLELRIHEAGSEAGSEIARTVIGPPPQPGTWIPLQLDVDVKKITWARVDVPLGTVSEHSRFRGDYLHVGRSADNGRISIRNLQVS